MSTASMWVRAEAGGTIAKPYSALHEPTAPVESPARPPSAVQRSGPRVGRRAGRGRSRPRRAQRPSVVRRSSTVALTHVKWAMPRAEILSQRGGRMSTVRSRVGRRRRRSPTRSRGRAGLSSRSRPAQVRRLVGLRCGENSKEKTGAPLPAMISSILGTVTGRVDQDAGSIGAMGRRNRQRDRVKAPTSATTGRRARRSSCAAMTAATRRGVRRRSCTTRAHHGGLLAARGRVPVRAPRGPWTINEVRPRASASCSRRYRVASQDERRFVRDTLRSHLADTSRTSRPRDGGRARDRLLGARSQTPPESVRARPVRAASGPHGPGLHGGHGRTDAVLLPRLSRRASRATLPLTGSSGDGMDRDRELRRPRRPRRLRVAGLLGERLARAMARAGAEVIRVEGEFGRRWSPDGSSPDVDGGPQQRSRIVQRRELDGRGAAARGLGAAGREHDALLLWTARRRSGVRPADRRGAGGRRVRGEPRLLGAPPGSRR